MPLRKSAKEQNNREIVNMGDSGRDVKSFVDKIFGDLSKKSAAKQALIGLSSGWYALYFLLLNGIYFLYKQAYWFRNDKVWEISQYSCWR